VFRDGGAGDVHAFGDMGDREGAAFEFFENSAAGEVAEGVEGCFVLSEWLCRHVDI
jgi:hypothetical protein